MIPPFMDPIQEEDQRDEDQRDENRQAELERKLGRIPGRDAYIVELQEEIDEARRRRDKQGAIMSKTIRDMIPGGRRTGRDEGTRPIDAVVDSKFPCDEPRDVERLAALELGTTKEEIDQKLMNAHQRAVDAEAVAAGVRAAHLLEKIAHADTKLELWKERYNRSGERIDRIHREIEDLQAESRGEKPRWIAPERGR